MDSSGTFHFLNAFNPDEFRALIAVLSSVTLFYLIAFALFLYRLFTPGKDRTDNQYVNRTGDVILLIAAIGLILIGYSFLVEPYWLEVKHVQLKSPRLKNASRPIRVVQISDLHCERMARLEGMIPHIIEKEKPDLIVFTGDAANSPAGIPLFKRCMTRLSKIAPTFAVAGNWDPKHVFENTGVHALFAEAVPLKVAGTTIRVAGVAAWDQNLLKVIGALPGDQFTIFLDHYSDAIFKIAESRKVDLYLSGHTHGGQVALPFYGAIVTFAQFGKRFESGLYYVRGTWLYVNRGIGMNGGWIPRMRFCARPEITVFELSPLNSLMRS